MWFTVVEKEKTKPSHLGFLAVRIFYPVFDDALAEIYLDKREREAGGRKREHWEEHGKGKNRLLKRTTSRLQSKANLGFSN